MVVFVEFTKNLQNTLFFLKFHRNHHLDCDKNHINQRYNAIFHHKKKSWHFARPFWRYSIYGQLRCTLLGLKKYDFRQFPKWKYYVWQAKNNPFFHYLPPKPSNITGESHLSIFFGKMSILPTIPIQTTLSLKLPGN